MSPMHCEDCALTLRKLITGIWHRIIAALMRRTLWAGGGGEKKKYFFSQNPAPPKKKQAPHVLPALIRRFQRPHGTAEEGSGAPANRCGNSYMWIGYGRGVVCLCSTCRVTFTPRTRQPMRSQYNVGTGAMSASRSWRRWCRGHRV